MKKMIKLLLSGMLLFSLVACQNVTSKTESVVNLAVANAPSSLNSLTTSLSDNVKIMQNFGEGLVRRNISDTVEAGIAESWDISPDGLTYTFQLKDAVWENGDAITAQDFEFAWKKVATIPGAEQKSQMYYLKNGKAVAKDGADVATLGVKAIDDQTLEVTLETPISYFLQIISTYTFFPVQEAFYESVGGDENYGTTVDTIMANGAYKLASYAADSGYTLVKNENYWDADNVNVETVNVNVVSMPDTQAIMYEQGELDILLVKDSLVDKYESHEDLQMIKSDGMEYIYLSGNTETPAPVLANTNFKAAIAHAIDKTILTDTILKNGSVAADYLIPQSFVSLDGVDYREASGTFYDLSYDVDQAKTFLAAAKAELGDIPLEFTLTFPDDNTHKKILENIKSQVETNLPEVTINIETLPTQLFYPTLDEFETPAARSAWSPTVKDPTSFFNLFLSDNFLNSGRYSNAEYDAMVNQMSTAEIAQNEASRWELFFEAETILLHDYTIIPLYQKGEKWLVHANLENVVYTTGAGHSYYRFYTIK